MSGYIPFFNKRRGFIKQSFGFIALSAINPLRLFAKSSKTNTNMVQIIKKSEQYSGAVFGNRFIFNKPVYNGQSNVKPFASCFYWSNSLVVDDCGFGLHPHEGFEIMTFLFEGSAEHFDTASQVWTPLNAGDFQIIQSNSGIHHQEKVYKNLRGLQIWFDPNFNEAIKQKPSYIDYHAKDFLPKEENGVKTISYIGNGSSVKAMTPGLTMKKLIFDEQTKMDLQLNQKMSYIFYVLNGKGLADSKPLETDDAIRISETTALSIDFKGELFYAEMPTTMEYKPVWA